MKKFLKRLNKNEEGQGMIEYVLILLVVVGAVLALRGKFTEWSDTAANKVEGELGNF